MKILKLSDGNQHANFFSANVSLSEIDEVKSSYTWDNFSEDENLMWEMGDLLFSDAVNQQQVIDNKSDREFWSKLNKSQKVLRAFNVFDNTVRHSVFFEFFYNSPQYSYVMIEVFKELGQTKLMADYTTLLFTYIKEDDFFNGVREQIKALPNSDKYSTLDS
ncbi:hypothetical protein [Fulvitalea axinellae]